MGILKYTSPKYYAKRAVGWERREREAKRGLSGCLPWLVMTIIVVGGIGGAIAGSGGTSSTITVTKPSTLPQNVSTAKHEVDELCARDLGSAGGHLDLGKQEVEGSQVPIGVEGLETLMKDIGPIAPANEAFLEEAALYELFRSVESNVYSYRAAIEHPELTAEAHEASAAVDLRRARRDIASLDRLVARLGLPDCAIKT